MSASHITSPTFFTANSSGALDKQEPLVPALPKSSRPWVVLRHYRSDLDVPLPALADEDETHAPHVSAALKLDAAVGRRHSSVGHYLFGDDLEKLNFGSAQTTKPLSKSQQEVPLSSQLADEGRNHTDHSTTSSKHDASRIKQLSKAPTRTTTPPPVFSLAGASSGSNASSGASSGRHHSFLYNNSLFSKSKHSGTAATPESSQASTVLETTPAAAISPLSALHLEPRSPVVAVNPNTLQYRRQRSMSLQDADLLTADQFIALMPEGSSVKRRFSAEETKETAIQPTPRPVDPYLSLQTLHGSLVSTASQLLEQLTSNQEETSKSPSQCSSLPSIVTSISASTTVSSATTMSTIAPSPTTTVLKTHAPNAQPLQSQSPSNNLHSTSTTHTKKQVEDGLVQKIQAIQGDSDGTQPHCTSTDACSVPTYGVSLVPTVDTNNTKAKVLVMNEEDASAFQDSPSLVVPLEAQLEQITCLFYELENLIVRMAHVMQKHIPTEDYRVFLKDTGEMVKLARSVIAESHGHLHDKDQDNKHSVGSIVTNDSEGPFGKVVVQLDGNIDKPQGTTGIIPKVEQSKEHHNKDLDDVCSFIQQILNKADEKVKEYADVYHEFIVVPTPGFRIEGINNLGVLRTLANEMYHIKQKQKNSSNSCNSTLGTGTGTGNKVAESHATSGGKDNAIPATAPTTLGQVGINFGGEPMARMKSLPQSRDEWAAVQRKHTDPGIEAFRSEIEPYGEHMGHEAYYYRNWFLGKEHRTFVGQVDGLGTVIISIVREPVSSGGPNAMPTRSQTANYPSSTHNANRPELPHTSQSFHFGERTSDVSSRHMASPRTSTEGMRAAFGILTNRSDTQSLPGSVATTTHPHHLAPTGDDCHPTGYLGISGSGGPSGMSPSNQTPPIHPTSIPSSSHGTSGSGGNTNTNTNITNNNTRWQYRCILRQKDADTIRLTIPEPELGPLNLTRRAGKPQWKAVLQLIHPAITQQVASKLRKVQKNNHSFERDLAKFDETMLRFNYKFGVLLVQKGQTHEEEWFGNQSEDSPSFESFLNSGILGEKVALKGFDRFAAGLDTRLGETGEYSYFDTWGTEYEVMYHVSTLLPYNTGDRQQIQRKRHIGNDIVCIVYVDGVQPFMPTAIKSQFLHIFILIHEIQLPNGTVAYSATIACDEHVPDFGPQLPNPPIFFDPRDLRRFLLSKTINGENAAYKAPRLIKPHQRARSGMLENLVAKANSLTPDSINTDKANSKFKQKGSSSSLAPLHSANSLMTMGPASLASSHPPLPQAVNMTPNATKGKPFLVASSKQGIHHIQSCPASGASDGGESNPDVSCLCPSAPSVSQDDSALVTKRALSFASGVLLEDRRNSLSMSMRLGNRNPFVTLGSETAASIFKMRRRSSNAAESSREDLGISSNMVLPLKNSSTWSSSWTVKRAEAANGNSGDGKCTQDGVDILPCHPLQYQHHQSPQSLSPVISPVPTTVANRSIAHCRCKLCGHIVPVLSHSASEHPMSGLKSENESESEQVPVASPMMPATQTFSQLPVSASPSPTKEVFDTSLNPQDNTCGSSQDSLPKGLATYADKERSKSEVDLLSSVHENQLLYPVLYGGAESVMPPHQQALPPCTKKGRAQQFLNTLVRRRVSSNDTMNLGPSAPPLSKLALLAGINSNSSRSGSPCTCYCACVASEEYARLTMPLVQSSPPLSATPTAASSSMPTSFSQPLRRSETPPLHPHHIAPPPAHGALHPPIPSHSRWQNKDKESSCKHPRQQIHINASSALITAQLGQQQLQKIHPLQVSEPQPDGVLCTAAPSTIMSNMSSRSSTFESGKCGKGLPVDASLSSSPSAPPSLTTSTEDISPTSFHSFASHLSDVTAAAGMQPSATAPRNSAEATAAVAEYYTGMLNRQGSYSSSLRKAESIDKPTLNPIRLSNSMRSMPSSKVDNKGKEECGKTDHGDHSVSDLPIMSSHSVPDIAVVGLSESPAALTPVSTRSTENDDDSHAEDDCGESMRRRVEQTVVGNAPYRRHDRRGTQDPPAGSDYLSEGDDNGHCHEREYQNHKIYVQDLGGNTSRRSVSMEVNEMEHHRPGYSYHNQYHHPKGVAGDKAVKRASSQESFLIGRRAPAAVSGGGNLIRVTSMRSKIALNATPSTVQQLEILAAHRRQPQLANAVTPVPKAMVAVLPEHGGVRRQNVESGAMSSARISPSSGPTCPFVPTPKHNGNNNLSIHVKEDSEEVTRQRQQHQQQWTIEDLEIKTSTHGG
ncbi:Rap/ran-GAP protein [Actinomortierella wolfii]|nr:Rap/ran-GAP protein [Actinomortierella wolfii]